jgi:hypothetical protein
MTETSTTTENRQGVLAIGLLALAEHIAQHQLPFPMDIYSPAGLDAPYLRIRVSGAGDQMRWLNTVHVDGETSEPLDTGAGRWTTSKQPKKKDRGPIPARQGNGYYADHTTGDRLRSVTTILSGGVPKPASSTGPGTCAPTPRSRTSPLVAASRFPEQLAELRNWIRKAHTRKKDERAEVGSAVHGIIESRILGTTPPASVKVGEEEWALDGPELAPYVANFLRFEHEWKPTWRPRRWSWRTPSTGTPGRWTTHRRDGLIGDALRAMGYDVGRRASTSWATPRPAASGTGSPRPATSTGSTPRPGCRCRPTGARRSAGCVTGRRSRCRRPPRSVWCCTCGRRGSGSTRRGVGTWSTRTSGTRRWSTSGPRGSRRRRPTTR